MKSLHIAFCVEQAYGHIVPTLGITLELLRRGHRVSYAVTESFGSFVTKIGAVAKIIDPLETRSTVLPMIVNKSDLWVGYDRNQPGLVEFYEDIKKQRTERSLSQLERIYNNDPPDVVVHDDCYDTAGRELACKLGATKIRHHSQFLDAKYSFYKLEDFVDDQIVLMTVPEFFQPDRADLDQRFRFVGFIPEGRIQGFDHWTPKYPRVRPILITATTGLLPQKAFFELMINAFGDQPWYVVLSISGRHDVVSSMLPSELSRIPANFEINRLSANFEIVEHSSLYIGQGGQGGSLEAIFYGVPQIIIPASDYHDCVGNRIEELGLGRCIPSSEAIGCHLVDVANEVLNDTRMVDRLRDVSRGMRENQGARAAAGIIEESVL